MIDLISSVGTIVTDIASKSLDALWLRSNVISDNIANSDTVNYKSKSVSFEDQLADALDGGVFTSSDLASINPKIIENDGTYGVGLNGVDLETQMIELARNSLQSSYLQRGISDNLGLILTAASEGR